LNINIQYDSSVNGAPAGFKSAVSYAVQFLDSAFPNPVTINVDVGYGEVAGQSLGSGALGESLTNITPVSYAQLHGALPAGTLPTIDPTNGGSFYIATAEAKALGLLGASSSLDGSVGFSSTYSFTYDPSNRAVAGSYDFIGVVEHEITEVMGRISMLDSGGYSLLDLFRYSAPGVHSFVPTQAAYFSIDGGHTNLDNFNTNPSGDFGDWAASAGNDSFLAFSSAGVMNAFSSADTAVMNALGYGTSSSTSASGPALTAVVEQPATGVLNAGKAVTITLDFTETVTVAGGIPSLVLNDGGTATYASGSGTDALSFHYVVGSQDSNVTSLAATAVRLNGATILDSSANSANLSLNGLTQSGPQIDTTIPAVTAIIEQPASGVLTVGKMVVIVLDLSEAVIVAGGVPTLALNDGGIAAYASGSDTNALRFDYTVGTQDSDVSSLAVSSVNLNGSTIQDIGGNNANLVLSGITQSGPQIGSLSAMTMTIQNDYLAITRTALPVNQATAITNAIDAGTQTEAQYINGLLSQVADTTIPAVAVEGSMYGVVGTSAEITFLATQFLPAQLGWATQHGFSPEVFACQVLGQAFAFGNENGATTFADNFGPSNAAMPNTHAGDAAFAAAVASAVFGSAANAGTVTNILGWVSYFEAYFTQNGIPGIANPTTAQIDLAARGTAWGDAVGVAVANNLGPLAGQTTNFLEDAAQGTAIYSASLTSQPNHAPFQGASSVLAPALDSSITGLSVGLTGVADHIHTGLA
jgi:hypothetical protein